MSTDLQANSERSTEQLGGRLLDMINHSGLSMMISVGHRTGLFDTMARMPAATSHEIAGLAELDERYVREWLGACVAGDLLDYDPAAKTYRLPPEHAALLTRDAAPNNAASMMQWVAVLGSVEDQIVDCFREGGGLHYGHFARFHEVMAEESSQTVVAALRDHILPLVPDVLERLENGISVLDVGCGSGRAMISLAETFPQSQFVGMDFSEEAIERARQEAAQRGVANIHFECRDAAAIIESNRFDMVTAFDSIHDQAHPAKVLQGIYRALRKDGVFLMQDIMSSSHVEKNKSNPIGAFLYTISTMHCMTVSLAHGGCGLGTCWGEELANEMLQEAGFKQVDQHHLEHDIMNTYFVSRKSA